MTQTHQYQIVTLAYIRPNDTETPCQIIYRTVLTPFSAFWHGFLTRLFYMTFWHDFLAWLFGMTFWHDFVTYQFEMAVWKDDQIWRRHIYHRRIYTTYFAMTVSYFNMAVPDSGQTVSCFDNITVSYDDTTLSGFGITVSYFEITFLHFDPALGKPAYAAPAADNFCS